MYKQKNIQYRAFCATSRDEKDACYRLRYRIYVDHKKILPPDHPYVVGDQLIDPYDAYSTQILLLAGDEVAGTARVTCARDGALELEAYTDGGCHLWPRATTCEITRLMILPKWRSFQASGELFFCLFRTFIRLGAHRVLAAGKLGSLTRYYENLGLQVIHDDPFAYRLIPNAYYRIMLGDFGAPKSLRRWMWRMFFGGSYRMLNLAPELLSLRFRRGLSTGRARAPSTGVKPIRAT